MKKGLIGTKFMIEFIHKMNQAGYSLRKGRGLGLVENKTGMYYKASDLGLSLQKIEKIIEFNQSLERQINNPSFQANNYYYQQNNQSSTNDTSTKSHEQSSSNFINDLLFSIGQDLGSGGVYYGGSPAISESEEEKKKKRKKKRGFSR